MPTLKEIRDHTHPYDLRERLRALTQSSPVSHSMLRLARYYAAILPEDKRWMATLDRYADGGYPLVYYVARAVTDTRARHGGAIPLRFPRNDANPFPGCYMVEEHYGDVLCGTCANDEELWDDWDVLTVEISHESPDWPEGQYCDHCGEAIHEPDLFVLEQVNAPEKEQP